MLLLKSSSKGQTVNFPTSWWPLTTVSFDAPLSHHSPKETKIRPQNKTQTTESTAWALCRHILCTRFWSLRTDGSGPSGTHTDRAENWRRWAISDRDMGRRDKNTDSQSSLLPSCQQVPYPTSWLGRDHGPFPLILILPVLSLRSAHESRRYDPLWTGQRLHGRWHLVVPTWSWSQLPLAFIPRSNAPRYMFPPGPDWRLDRFYTSTRNSHEISEFRAQNFIFGIS